MNPEVIVTNIKKRFTGVSGTISALLPVQSKALPVALVGDDVPGAEIAARQSPQNFGKLSLWQAIRLSRQPLPNGKKRIWHVRRDHEMMLAIFLRDVLRCPIKLVFTSAAKHQHGWWPRWLIRQMDGVIATTPEAGRMRENTTKVVFHGTSLDRFSPPADKAEAWARTGLPGKYGIGVFGRIRPSKGTDVYVDAMLEVLPDFPDFTAVITGRAGPEHAMYKAKMEKKIAEAGLQDRIVFVGDLPAEQVPSWYQNVLVMVACPRYEPFGITPLEGMASGCAVVASRTGAFEYIVQEDKTGHMVPTGDPAALAVALRKLLADPARTAAMGLAGRERVLAQFSVEKEAEGIHEVYRHVQDAA